MNRNDSLNNCSLKVERSVEDELQARLNALNNQKAALKLSLNKQNQISPAVSFYSNASFSTLMTSSNNLVIDEDVLSQSNSFYNNNLHDASPTTGNYGSLIELKENVFERKHNFKVFEYNIMKLKQKKIKEQQQQYQQNLLDGQLTVPRQQLDHQKHDYYEINRKLQENLRKQKLLFNKASNLLNNELRIQIINDNLNKRFNLNRSLGLNSTDNLDYSCKQCNCGFEKLNSYLNHLYSEEHLKHIGGLSSTSVQSVCTSGSNGFLDELSIIEKDSLKGS